eukprot:403330858
MDALSYPYQEAHQFDEEINAMPAFSEINIFIVPHSHTDPGWLETMEQYYNTQVRDILYNVLVELKSDPKKKFTWAEVCYLKMFYDEIKPIDRENLKILIENGQLEIVGGGWVQHDETLTTYQQQIAQMDAGIDWLRNTFPGIESRLKTLWQIDPFGSSEITPLLFSSSQQSTDIQFENIVLNRIGDTLKNQLKQEHSMDFIWQNQFSQENDGLLTHVLHRHYDTLENDFLKKYLFEPLLQKDLQPFFKGFHNKIVRKYLKNQNHNNIFFLVGNDFSFVSKPHRPNQQDTSNFKIIDNMIRILNAHSKSQLNYQINAKYASTSDYFESLSKYMKNGELELPYIQQDFSHYDEQFHILHPEFNGRQRIDYWTGYYSNRPVLKQTIYQAFNSFFHAQNFMNLGQLIIDSQTQKSHSTLTQEQQIFNELSNNSITQGNFTFSQSTAQPFSRKQLSRYLADLQQVIAIGTHHDTIPSTSKDFVHASELTKFNQVIEGSGVLLQKQFLYLMGAEERLEDESLQHIDPKTFKPLKTIKQYIEFNNEPFKRIKVAKYTVSSKYVIVKYGNQLLKSETTNTFICSDQIGQIEENSFAAHFIIEVPSLSANIVEILEFNNHELCLQESKQYCSTYISPTPVKKDQQAFLRNDKVDLKFNIKNRMLESMKLFSENLSILVDQEIVRYSGVESESGAYIFAPAQDYVKLKLSPLDTFKVVGSIQQSLITFYKTAYKPQCFAVQTINLDQVGDNQDNPQVKFKSFTLENDDIFMKIKTNLTNTELFRSNSLYHQKSELTKRLLSPRDLGSQFFPSVQISSLVYNNSQSLLSFFTGERPTGIASHQEGEIMFGIGRNNNYNDDKGLPDGVKEDKHIHLQFSFGKFSIQDIKSLRYQQKIKDQYSSPMVIRAGDKVYDFMTHSISFMELSDKSNKELIYFRFNNLTQQYELKLKQEIYIENLDFNCQYHTINSNYIRIEQKDNQEIAQIDSICSSINNLNDFCREKTNQNLESNLGLQIIRFETIQIAPKYYINEISKEKISYLCQNSQISGDCNLPEHQGDY